MVGFFVFGFFFVTLCIFSQVGEGREGVFSKQKMYCQVFLALYSPTRLCASLTDGAQDMLRSDFISIYPGQVQCEYEDFLCSYVLYCHPLLLILSSLFKEASLAQP